MAIALGVTLSGSPSQALANNAIPSKGIFMVTGGNTTVCQGEESLPRGTSAIRLWLGAIIGPKVTVTVLSHGRLLTSGTRGSGWTANSVTIPVRSLAVAAPTTTDCLTVADTRTTAAFIGNLTDKSIAARSSQGRPLPGRMRIEYLRAGGQTWWSLAVSIARRMGLGHAVAGTWIPVLVLVLMLLLTALTSWLTVRELGSRRRATPARRVRGSKARVLLSRVPLAAWICVLVACLNAVCWSLATPPFQVPDEPDHFAYVQLLAVNRALPTADLPSSSRAEQVALAGLHFEEVRLKPPFPSLSNEAQQRTLESDLAAPASPTGYGGAGTASPEPPLYYALETIPYQLGSGGSVLDRLELMRLLSALLAGVTAFFAYLFVREVLPGSRWTWTVGGLAVALFPLLGNISGAVNPDAMLCAVCAALFYCLGRAFHRGLTRGLALAVAIATAIGLMTKLSFVGFVPGVLLGLIVLAVRASRRGSASVPGPGRIRARWLSLALAIAVSPALLYILVNLLSNRPALGVATSTIDQPHGSFLHEAVYIWQFYLPRLPGMSNDFPGIFTTRQLWFNGLVGMYGWADTLFPGWVYDLALVPAASIAALAARELIRRRDTLRGRIPELIIYVLIAVGMMTVVGTQSYISDFLNGREPYWEPRYLLPMLALWGLPVALAARGAGRRWGPVVGVVLIVLFLAHDVFSQLQVIARFYG